MGTISFALLTTVVSLTPAAQGVVAFDRVALVEVNHVYDDRGKPIFSQVIFYDWSSTEGRFQVRAWRMLKSKSQVPHRDWQANDFVTVWQDDGVLREVHADTMRESWTQYDPELIEREHLPKEHRRELHRIPRAKSGG